MRPVGKASALLCATAAAAFLGPTILATAAAAPAAAPAAAAAAADATAAPAGLPMDSRTRLKLLIAPDAATGGSIMSASAEGCYSLGGAKIRAFHLIKDSGAAPARALNALVGRPPPNPYCVQLCAGRTPWLAPLCNGMDRLTWGAAPEKPRISHVVVYNSAVVGGGRAAVRSVCGAKPNRKLGAEPEPQP